MPAAPTHTPSVQVVRIQCFSNTPQCSNSPVGAIFPDSVSVKVNMTLPAPYTTLPIHFTTDGTAPTTSSPVYSAANPPTLASCNTLVGAQAFGPGGEPQGLPTYSRWLQTSCA
jgi:hypothetical protein